MQYKHVYLLAALAVTGCRKSEPAPTHHEMGVAPADEPPPPERQDAAVPAPLPATGMLCFTGTRLYVWGPDGSITEREAYGHVLDQDGSVSQVKLGADGKSRQLVAVTGPAHPPLDVPDNWEVFHAPSGSLLALDKNAARVWRNGAWKDLKTPPTFDQFRVANVVEHAGEWWIDTGELVHESGDALVDVKLKEETAVAGLLSQGDDLFVLLGSVDSEGKYPLSIAHVKKGALEKPKKIGELASIIASKHWLAANAAGSWAVFAQGTVYGTIHTSVAGKISNPSRDAVGLVGIDGHDRAFFHTDAGWVASSPDGTQQTFPKASNEMFALDDVRCGPLGKGFETLPGAGKAQTGTVVVEVAGGANLPVAVCDRLRGVQRCEESPGKITGTLDASGHFSAKVPIGEYTATVQVNGAWLVADIQNVDVSKTAPWFCTVKPDASCTIQLRAR